MIASLPLLALLTVLPAQALFGQEDSLVMGLGPYGQQVTAGPASLSGLDLTELSGFELTIDGFEKNGRFELLDTPPDAAEPETAERNKILAARFFGRHLRLRAYLDPGYQLQVDQLHIDGGLLSIRVRPQLGDTLDIGLLGGSVIHQLAVREDEHTRIALLAPGNLTLLGLSNTDQDNDQRLKHYLSIGTGIGVDLLTRLIGPLGGHLRLLSEVRTQNRHRAGARNTVRHEVVGQLDAGLALLLPRSAWTLASWGEQRAQWEPRDAGGRDGVDRQATSWGVHLGLRFFGLQETAEDPPSQPEPDHIASRSDETRYLSW